MLKSLGFYLSLSLLSAGMSVTATFLLTHTLSPSQYGIGMLFTSSIAMIATLCSVGMDQVFLRFFYENEYQNQTSFLLYCCVSFVGISIFCVFTTAAFFTHCLGEFFHLAGWLVWCLMLIGEIVFILQIFSSLLPRLYGKPSLYAIGQVFQKAAFLISTVLLLALAKKNSMVIIYSQLFALGVCSAVLIYFYRGAWKFTTKLFHRLKLTEVKKLFSYGFPFTFSNGLGWIFFNIDKFLLLKWSNANTLGIYTAAFVLSMPLETLRSLFVLAWMPRCHQLLIETPLKGKKIFHNTFHQVLWVFTVFTSILLLLKGLIAILLGNQFRGAEDIFGWLLLSIYFYGLSDIVIAGILKCKKTYWNIIISTLCLLANIVACYYLIPRFGAQGAALANALSFSLFFLMRYAIGFYYYSFKILHWKVFLYVFYLCGAITLSNNHDFGLQLANFIVFISISFCLEKKWLVPYLRNFFSFISIKRFGLSNRNPF